jgi:uncharacterized membrane protein YfcA
MEWDGLGILAVVVGLVAGATASLVGFGIGSLLTPLLSIRFGTELAVAMVAIPHAAGSLLRGWRLRHAIDWRVLAGFGILSAAGGLTGALLYAKMGSAGLTRTLGALLILTSLASLSGWAARTRVSGAAAWLLGGLSGLFGGLVGNQGGLRAAALSAFRLSPTAFVATSTATGILIDAVRTPVYLWRTGGSLMSPWALILGITVAVLAGTLAGEKLLFGVSREAFRIIVSIAVGLLGLWLLATA